MRITEIRGVHIELTDALRSYIEEKMGSLEKLCEGYSPCDVALEVGKTTTGQQKGDIWKAEATMVIPGHTLRVERVTDDLYAAIDLAKDALKQQLVDVKR